MYNLKRNNYHSKPKPSNIQTPLPVSQFLYELLKDKIPQNGLIFDPCCRIGSLLKPWKNNGWETYGIDQNENSTTNFKTDFLKVSSWWNLANQEPSLILCNPPFNGQKSPKIKRDYSKCFLCGSNDLWSGGKQAFCLECKNSVNKCPTCWDCMKPVNGSVINHHKDCSPERCSYQGEKDYFSICYACYEQVPVTEVINGKFKDWEWIIEKQKEIETKSVSRLGSEVWLDKIIELFGKDIPIVLFVPAGFCLNLTLTSQRKMKFEDGTYPPIASRITLPKNIFEGVIFHSELLIFNVKGLKGHYFYKEDYENWNN